MLFLLFYFVFSFCLLIMGLIMNLIFNNVERHNNPIERCAEYAIKE